MGRKIVISRGFGAGWSTWVRDDDDDRLQQRVAEYQPVIDFIESGAKPTIDGYITAEFAAVIEQMKTDLGLDYFYDGGAKGLMVVEVEPPYQVTEYDGSESWIQASDLWQ